MAIVWRLNEVMARYHIRGVDLIEDTGLTKETVSRLRNRETMPTIGQDRLDELMKSLSRRSKGAVKLTDLIDCNNEDTTP
jgi:DNA-binding Xre family transcriptional regulator